MAEVADDYIIADGESFTIPVSMMDSRRMITDSRGNPAGQRPGFLYSDSEQADAVRETAYAMYNDDISNRWRSDRWQRSGNLGTMSKSNQTGNLPTVGKSDPLADAVEQAHAQYRADIESRWRR
jgi:hypothetical protein